MISQLTQVTSDGLPNKDAPFECVSTSILASVMYLLGVKELGGKFTPDYFKDQTYGESYQGGTSADRYVDLCKSFGVKLYPIDGTLTELIEQAHTTLARGVPVIFTEVDPYVPASYGWTHACVWYADSPGQLTALDPYIGRSVTKSDQEWLNVLAVNQLWLAEKLVVEEEMKVVELTDPEVAHYFELGPSPHTWRCRSNGKIIQDAMLKFYQGYGNAGLCGLTFLGLPLSNEVYFLPGKPVAKQFFERGVLIYDPDHLIDNPPGSGEVYLLHLYNNGPGQDPQVGVLEQKITDLQKTQNSALLAAIEKIKADVAALP